MFFIFIQDGFLPAETETPDLEKDQSVSNSGKATGDQSKAGWLVSHLQLSFSHCWAKASLWNDPFCVSFSMSVRLLPDIATMLSFPSLRMPSFHH